MIALAERASLTMTRRRWAETERVEVDPLASSMVLRLLRPPKRSQIKTSLILCVDGDEYVCSGQISGGRVGQYQLRYTPPVVRRSFQILRIGELSRHRLEAYVRVEVLRGDATADLLGAWLTTAPTPQYPIHNSVAFDAATSAEEIAGDGVLSLAHTSTGSGRAVFAGTAWDNANAGTGSTSMTYAGAGMTEMWDIAHSTETRAQNAGYRLHNQSATAASTVTSDLVSTEPLRHFLGVVSMTGVDQTTPVGTANTAEGTATPATVTVSGVAADDMVVDIMGLSNGGSAPVVGADQTERWAQSDSDIYTSGSTQPGTAGGVMSWTLNAPDYWLIGAVAFKTGVSAYTLTPVEAGSYALTGATASFLQQSVNTWLRVGR